MRWPKQCRLLACARWAGEQLVRLNGRMDQRACAVVLDVNDNAEMDRTPLQKLVGSASFSNIVLAAIVTNVIVLILSASETMDATLGPVLFAVHKMTLLVFVIEMILKLMAYQWSFFRSAWNIFDFVIVIVAMVPAVGNMSMLRIVRLARAMRLFTAYRTLNNADLDDAEREALDSGSLRGKVWSLMERQDTRNFILGVIILNGILLGITTSSNISPQSQLIVGILDRIIVVIFVIEMILKLYAYRLRFFASAWNIFDLIIVVISLLPQNDALAVLRGMRVIRALRVMSTIPQMREVVKALLDAVPGMGAVALLLGVMFYIFGIMATLWFGEAFPEWFGTLGASLYSLFQIMTLESWSMGIVRPVMEEFPWAWAFFVPFIIMTAFAVLNLFIGLLVNTMQAAVEEEHEREIEDMRRILQEENAALSGQIDSLRKDVQSLVATQARDGNGDRG